ncbi:hypothetical protein [Streptomyces sp. NPDC051636]|uniref:hypothetical protein n=1 Tax=Streptomyces sp. NPDC051636 TaxID=3365663 RepID=UPI003792F1D1
MLESFRLDTRGVREVLNSAELRSAVDGLAGAIAAHVRPNVPTGTVVSVRAYTTDRGAASVTVEDVRAMAWQARDGILTRAAGEVGLEVRAWQ